MIGRAALPRSIVLALHVGTHSGPQRSLMPRLQELARQGTRVTTLVPQEGPAAEHAAGLGEVIVGSPGALLAPRSPAALIHGADAMRQQAATVSAAASAADAELVIVSSVRMPGALRGARRAGVATLLYAGDPLVGSWHQRLMAEPVLRLALGGADAVVVPSHAVARAYSKRRADTHVVHPPIRPAPDPEGTRRRGRKLRKALGLDPEAKVVSSLGAITRGRGQDVLVRAHSRERERGAKWHLLIGGEAYARTPDRRFSEELRVLVRELGVQESVILLGRVDDADALYAASDVFVNPARVPESFGRAACEALGAGCPVVTTRVGGVIEALKPDETALFVAPEDEIELGAAITGLLADPSLAAALAASGRRDVTVRFASQVEHKRFEDAVVVAMATRAGRRSAAEKR